ncbi:hypothetical protein CF319_g9255, partial [Tilletia indica]
HLRREREGRAPPSPPYDGVEHLFYQDEEEDPLIEHGYPGRLNQPLEAAVQAQRQQDPAYLPQRQAPEAAVHAQRRQDPAAYLPHQADPLDGAAQAQRQQDPAYLPHQHQAPEAAAQAQRQQDPAYLPQRQAPEAAAQAERREDQAHLPNQPQRKIIDGEDLGTSERARLTEAGDL